MDLEIALQTLDQIKITYVDNLKEKWKLLHTIVERRNWHRHYRT